MKKTLLSITALAVAILSQAEENKCFTDKLNAQGFGTFSGKVQSLTMSRDYNAYADEDEKGDTSTLALTLNYKSPEVAGFSFNGQWISSASIWEHNPDRPINNNFNILTEAHVNWNWADFGLDKTNLKAGRMIPDSLMIPGIAPRQKPQAIEGIVFETEDIADSKLSLGWIRKFSSWSTRHKNESGDFGFNYEFTDIADLAGKDYHTDGTYFIDYTYTGIKRLKINIGNYYSEDILNTAHADITWEIVDGIKWRNIWANQHSVGQGDGTYGMDGEHNLSSNYLETSLQFDLCEHTYIRPGVWYVPGRNDGDDSHDFVDLFQADLTPTWPLMANPYGFQAGTKGYFVEGATELTEKDSVWGMLTYTNVDNTPSRNEKYDGVELNVVYGHKFTDKFSTAVKLGYAILDGKEGTADTDAWDARLFLTYTF